MVMNNGNEDAFNKLAAQLLPTLDLTAQMPSPGYFAGRIEHILDRMELEARRIDELHPDAPQTSTLMCTLQTALQANFQMASLSVSFISTFAPPACCSCKSPAQLE